MIESFIDEMSDFFSLCLTIERFLGAKEKKKKEKINIYESFDLISFELPFV